MHLKLLCQMCNANQIFNESISTRLLRMRIWDSLMMMDGFMFYVRIVGTFLGFLLCPALFRHLNLSWLVAELYVNMIVLLVVPIKSLRSYSLA